METVAVVVPTRGRPAMLARCLEALAAARGSVPFAVHVCDSSPDPADRRAGEQATERYEWAHFHVHAGRNAAAARNACASVATETLLVNVDDDLLVEPDAIELLVARWRESEGRRVVGGSISWGDHWTRPMTMRRIGYARELLDGEAGDFLLGAFFLYPRAYALAWPWNERIHTSEDIFMGAVWRAKGVALLYEPLARALHPGLPTNFDPERVAATVSDQRNHIYALLFDSTLANPSASRTLAYETLGFLASARAYIRRPRWAVRFVRAWIAGHLALLADRRQLRELLEREPEGAEAAP